MQTYFLELVASWEGSRAHPGYFPPQQHSGTARRTHPNYQVGFSRQVLFPVCLVHCLHFALPASNTACRGNLYRQVEESSVRLYPVSGWLLAPHKVPRFLWTLFSLGFPPVWCTVVGSLTFAQALQTLCRSVSPYHLHVRLLLED